jgi:hypothetical protein
MLPQSISELFYYALVMHPRGDGKSARPPLFCLRNAVGRGQGLDPDKSAIHFIRFKMQATTPSRFLFGE